MPLDGNADGTVTAGDHFTRNFTVDPPAGNAVTVGIADFAHGTGQPINVSAAAGSGIPVTISQGTGVSSVSFTLNFNPSLLAISDFVLDPALAAPRARSPAQLPDRWS